MKMIASIQHVDQHDFVLLLTLYVLRIPWVSWARDTLNQSLR